MVCVMIEQKKMIQQDWGSRKIQGSLEINFYFSGVTGVTKNFLSLSNPVCWYASV